MYFAKAFAPAILAVTVLGGCGSEPDGSDDAARALFLNEHSDDPQALDQKFSIEAQSACSVEADDYLRSIAKYDFAWDDDAKGLMGVKFDKVRSQSEGPYILTLVSTRAKLSNAFGAFQRISLYCSYDLMRKKVDKFQTDVPN